MMYMLSKLQIKCQFRDNGCREVLLLDSLNEHTLNCTFNSVVKTCDKCFAEYTDNSSHDCIKALLELNRKANQEICKLKSEKENFLKTIQELSQNDDEVNKNILFEYT